MKNVTKTNVLFTFMTSFYLMFIFILRLIPPEIVGANIRLILPEIITLLPAFLYVTVMKPEGLGDMHFDLPSASNIVRIILMTLCLIPAVSVINMITSLFADNRAGALLISLTGNPLWLNLILMGLIPAVCEEYIFRGLIFHGYKKRNPFGAMIMSSFLFGLMHMNINQFVYAFIMGWIFSMLVYATGTIASSVTAHFVFNGFNVIMSHRAADIINKSSGGEEAVAVSTGDYVTAYILLILFAAAGVWAACRLFRRICEQNRGFANVKMMFKRENRKTYDEKQGKFFDGYVAVGILLCIAYMVIYR